MYVTLITEDPSNPAGLQDEVLVANEAVGEDWGCDTAFPCPHDINGDGDTDDIVYGGGHLINPALTTTTYKSTDGTELRPSETVVGTAADGTPLTSYRTADNLPASTDQADIDAMLARYFRAGTTRTLTAPAITGYDTITPSSPHTVTLAAGVNRTDFVYSNAETGGTTGEADTPEAAAGTATAATDDGSLAETGSSIKVISFAVAALCLGGGAVAYRLRV